MLTVLIFLINYWTGGDMSDVPVHIGFLSGCVDGLILFIIFEAIGAALYKWNTQRKLNRELKEEQAEHPERFNSNGDRKLTRARSMSEKWESVL